MRKRAAEREGGCNSMDLISELPHPILHHILCFLSQKEAVQTCVLSKSWRPIGSTRPKFDFRVSSFRRNHDTFVSVLEQTLQRYHAHKLSIQDFVLEMLEVNFVSILFLEKWVPLVMLDLGVKNFHLSFISWESAYFDLPSVVFEAEMLQELCLEGCNLDKNLIENVLFKHLKTLSLKRVYIVDETLEKILSCCRLIENVTLHRCEGLRTIKVIKAHRLKLFDFCDCELEDIGRIIEIDVPTLETIKIDGGPHCFSHFNKCFIHLKYLHLERVQLSEKSFDRFSCNFPCLEKLRLIDCYGFEEFKLFSRSIKYLTIEGMETVIKTAIDVPNIVRFKYEGDVLRSASFKTTSSDWKSKIVVWSDVNFDYDASSWFLDLYEMLKAFCESEISLDIYQWLVGVQHIVDDPPLVVQDTYGGLYEPVVVEHLHLRLSGHSSSSISAFINDLFRFCHPKYIGQYWYSMPDPESEEEERRQLTQCMWKILVMERENREFFWQQDLEQVSMEALDDYDNEWYPVRGTSLTKCAALWPDYDERQRVRFRLKWTEFS